MVWWFYTAKSQYKPMYLHSTTLIRTSLSPYLFHQIGSYTKTQPSLWSDSPWGCSCHSSFWCPGDPRRSVWDTETQNPPQWRCTTKRPVMHQLTNHWASTDTRETCTECTQHSPPHTLARSAHNYAPLRHRSCCLPQGTQSPHPPQQSSGRRELWCT